VRPVWSPALVVFAGGVGGGGLSVWFPLGPGEPYRPWYRCSPRYIDQVNITNIREAPRVHVQTTYVNLVNVTNVTNITYVNKTYVTAVRQDDFAAGRSVRNTSVRVDPREVQQVRPLAQPTVAAPARAIVTRPVARPVPVSNQRPMLINQQGKQIAARPNATPVAPPERPMQQVRPIQGRTIVAAPAHPVQNGAQGNQGGVLHSQPIAPVEGIQRRVNPETGTQPTTPNYVQPNKPNQPSNPPPERPNQPNPSQPNQPNRPNYQPNQPNYQQPVRPNQPSNPPPATENRQDFGPVQPTKRQEAPPPPVNNGSQERPTPPPAQERPAPPPQNDERYRQPPPQQQPKPDAQKPNNKNNKDQKKSDKDKKEEKKPE
jgi:hypothetical protein